MLKTKDKKINVIFIFFVFCILSSYIYVGRLYIIYDVFLAILSIIFFWERRKIKINRGFVFLISLILCENIISTLINVTPLKTGIYNYVYYYGLIFIFICLIMKNKYQNKFLTYFGMMMIPVNIYGVFEFLSKRSFINQFINSGAKDYQVYAFLSSNYRPFSVFVNPLVYGNILVCLFWIYKYLYKRNKFIIFLQLLTLLDLYSTQSRSAWVAFVATYFIYLVGKLNFSKIKVKKNTLFKKAISLIIVFSLLIIFYKYITFGFTQIYTRFSTVFGTQSTDVSKLQRLGTINLIKNYMFNSGILKIFFGNGFGSVNNFMANNLVLIPGFNTTDNQYVSYFFEFGLIGLLLYVILIIKVIYHYITYKYDDFYKVYDLIFLCICVNMFFYEINEWKVINFLFMLSLSVFISNNSYNKEKKIED